MDDVYWYLWILGGLFLTGMGIIPFVPEEVAVIGVATTVSRAQLNLWIGWLCCIIGIIGTDVVLYSIGRFGGERFFSYRWVKYFISTERRDRIAGRFHRHGIKFLLSGRLLPGVRTGIFVTAGAIHYPLWRFILADAIAIPVISFFYFGSWWASDLVDRMATEWHHAQNWVFLLLILGGGGYAFYRYMRYLKQKADGQAEELGELPESIVAQIEGTAPSTNGQVATTSPPTPPPPATTPPAPEPKETVPATPKPA